MAERIYIYDSTLRDGAQTSGVDFTTIDKQDIAIELDRFGIDYIEAGWPGANPTDDAFFARMPKLKKAKITAFSMTRKAKTSAANDPTLAAALNSGAKTLCIVGKTWDFHVKNALMTTLNENIKMIGESISHIKNKKREVIFDAEHFFDGYKANKDYALRAIKKAYESGARWVVLCDTNGGTLPHEISSIISEVCQHIPGSHLGIHCHNDTENAVANTLAAVNAGVRQVQGTINGVGERCGNANLISIIPTLMLKMGFETSINKENLKKIKKLSHFLDDKLNRPYNEFAPYIGSSAFAHKGGLHVSAVTKNAKSYEHIDPELVGNKRDILVSKQSGKANIIARLNNMGIDVATIEEEKIRTLIREIKERENKGYAYDSAHASFELLALKTIGIIPEFFTLNRFRVMDERRFNAKGKLVTLSEATIDVKIDGEDIMTVANGNGPVNALDNALRKALVSKYKHLGAVKLVDYKVRIISPKEGTGAITRVLIESEDEKGIRWTTIGVSANIVDASYNALKDSIIYRLMRSGK